MNELNLVVIPVSVFLCASKEEFQDVMSLIGEESNEFVPEHYGAATQTFRPEGYRDSAIICMDYRKLRDECGPEEAVSLLAHECLHVAQFVTETTRVNDTEGELEAYVIQAVLRWCLSVVGGVNG